MLMISDWEIRRKSVGSNSKLDKVEALRDKCLSLFQPKLGGFQCKFSEFQQYLIGKSPPFLARMVLFLPIC